MSAGRPMMSRHEGVSCDSCMKSNFSNLRYKCLICYDYDLCASCHDAGATSSRHTTGHPMQCILTRTDANMYYGGDSSTAQQAQSFTCSYCGTLGFTTAQLHDHIRSSHRGTATSEVVCPICAALPSGDPNHVTDDLASHIALVHRISATDFDEDQMTSIRHMRRLTHPTQMPASSSGTGNSDGSGTRGAIITGGVSGTPAGIGVSASRPSRSALMQLIEPPSLSGSSGRDAMDPIAELLSHISSVRSRTLGGHTGQHTGTLSSHFHQLEMQLSSNSVFNSFRQHLERLPSRPTDAAASVRPAVILGSVGGGSAAQQAARTNAAAAEAQAAASVVAGKTPAATATSSGSGSTTRSRFLLARCNERSVAESERAHREAEAADRSLFTQELLLTLLADNQEDILTGDTFSSQSLSADDLLASDCDAMAPRSSGSLHCSSTDQDSTNSLTADELDGSCAGADGRLPSQEGVCPAKEPFSEQPGIALSNGCDGAAVAISFQKAGKS